MLCKTKVEASKLTSHAVNKFNNSFHSHNCVEWQHT